MMPDGRFLKSLAIVRRETRETKIFQLDYTPDRVLDTSQENGFTANNVSESWLQDVLFPYIDKTRRRLR
jgi:hypothetical protein